VRSNTSWQTVRAIPGALLALLLAAVLWGLCWLLFAALGANEDLQAVQTAEVEPALYPRKVRLEPSPAREPHTTPRQSPPRLLPAKVISLAEATSMATEPGAPASTTVAEAKLLPANWEFAEDGLPVTAMDCTEEGDKLRCGECTTNADCPLGQGCAANRKTRRMECMASECEVDVHCFPGQVCRAVNAGDARSAPVRRCVPVGLREEGEPCDLEPLSVTASCQEGLNCVFSQCARPCQPRQPWSCPKGYICKAGLGSHGCVPDCRELGCPAGQRCKALEDGHYQCLVAVVGECPEVPCTEGERCNMDLSRGRAAFWCARVCNPLKPASCGPGEVCGRAEGHIHTCYQRCGSQDLDSCGPEQVCRTVSKDLSLWGCAPRAEL
jgi:hypothetical protein